MVRISIKISPNSYVPATFICDTGAPSYIYTNLLTRRLIKDRIESDDAGNEFIIIRNKRLSLDISPTLHEDTNILGLMALKFFMMYFEDNGVGFNFQNLPEYF